MSKKIIIVIIIFLITFFLTIALLLIYISRQNNSSAQDTNTTVSEPIQIDNSSNISTTGILYPKKNWDYGLTKKCIETLSPTQENYFTDKSGCIDDKHWLAVVQSETVNTIGKGCPGPTSQSFQINGAGSPVTLEWIENNDTSSPLTAHLKTDFQNVKNPCGSDYFTFFGIEANPTSKGDTLPNPYSLQASASFLYNDFFQGTNASRAFVGFQIWYEGKTYVIEYNLSEDNWYGNATIPDTGIVLVSTSYQSSGFDKYILIDAKTRGDIYPKNQDTQFSIKLKQLIDLLISQNILPEPQTGWELGVSQNVYFGTETHQPETSRPVVADAYIKGFKIDEQSLVDNLPFGYATKTNECKFRLWGYDRDTFAKQVTVEGYTNPYTPGQTPILKTTTNLSRKGVNDFLGISGDFGYDFDLPQSLLGKKSNLYFYVDNQGTNSNGEKILLSGSPLISNSPTSCN